ncbi:hypothetical protein A2799_03265 [Candidatus Roizmanbacteria bacterium RIFCSPHIGHO2_01_FULL_39_24]|uniref:Uncharacterized protein n=1 Tax=Candidatus Roizmanbacteria bacterium RIFCSPHIGHO2_01_FULL_39_24 TaxID=1802032 RepID=A0A1F7GEX3_9BACT|nr:MAG: hypothetical protein A2799_03265 [Candidatus Roizmanbacteria bacterium RIFCSPHIGHO2_01_FULL_39_24]
MGNERRENPLGRLMPKTTGEKMLAGAITIDLGVISSSVLITHLTKEGLLDLTAEQTQAIKDVLFWGGHIVVSDIILKVGGAVKMKFFEEENWFKQRES